MTHGINSLIQDVERCTDAAKEKMVALVCAFIHDMTLLWSHTQQRKCFVKEQI